MTAKGFIYFVQAEAGGPIKIGRAINVERRIRSLQSGNPSRLRLLAVAPGGVDEETTLHRRFAHLRRDREWFDDGAELEISAFVEAVQKEGKLPNLGTLFPSPNAALDNALAIIGTQSALAAIIGCTQQGISSVRRRGSRIPAEWCLPIERATKGKISRHDLRPDLFPPNEIAA